MDIENDARKDEMMEPAVVPAEPKPSPPSKAASVHSEEPEHEMKYETIKMNEPLPSNSCVGNKAITMEKMDKPVSVMNSSLGLMPHQQLLQQTPTTVRHRGGVSVNTKLGIIQLVLSVLLSAFGGLCIARNCSLSMLGSGVWSGVFAGIAGALGLMNIQVLLNGFLACSLVSVATSTLALALTGIGLVRDYNIAQQDPVSMNFVPNFPFIITISSFA